MFVAPVTAALAATTVIFPSRASGASKYRVLHDVAASDSGPAPGALLLDKKGDLYGAAYGGGAYGDGAVFELVPSSGSKWKEVIRYSFIGGSQGATPDWGLISDAQGNLYGVTPRDGGFSASTVFELSRDAHGWTHRVVH